LSSLVKFLGLPGCLLHSDVPIEILYIFSLMHSTCTALKIVGT
jgi:hypothetical protein